MSDSEKVSIRRCERIKRLLFMLCRFPKFSNEFIRQHIDKPDTDPAELEDYKANSTSAARLRSVLLVSVYVCWIFKNAYILWFWLNTLDLDNYANNVRVAPFHEKKLEWINQLGRGASLLHVSCLLTNCTRLGPLDFDYANPYPEHSSERLVEDVSRLPLVSLCDRSLGYILHGPIVAMDKIGMFAWTIIIYSHLLLGVWTTIQQTLSPASSDIILFVTSPKVTANVKRLRAAELLNDLSRSYRNFQLPFPSLWRRYREPICKSRIINMDFNEEQAVTNCMPSTRTEWWRKRLSRLFFNTLCQDLRALVELTLLIIGFSIVRFNQRTELYDRFELEMNAMQCNIWLDDVTTLDPKEAFRPGELDLGWTPVSLLDTAGLSFLGGITVALLLDYYWCIVQDLAVWLAETRMLMVASLVATRFQHECDWSQAKLELAINERKSRDYKLGTSLNQADGLNQCDHMSESMDEEQPSAKIGQDHFIDTRYFYKIPALRQGFQDSIVLKSAWLFERIEQFDKRKHNTSTEGANPSLPADVKMKRRFSWYRISSKNKDRVYVGKFLAQILFPLSKRHQETGLPAESFDKTDYDIDTMEQIYVNFRLLCEHVSEQPMKLSITITYLLNYGLVIICVIFRRQFPSLERETMFIIVFALIVANFLIILAADFHAQAKKLQPLLWSLIAQLTLSKSPRAQHMRWLWLKITKHLDEEGGLAMRAFGISVTYIFIIQLMIWTGTILSLALKPHHLEL